MDFPRTAAVSSLTVLAETASTNDWLLARAAESPEFAVVATTSQTSGRGRLGRVWVAPAGQSVAASVLLKPRAVGGAPLPIDDYGWLPLIAGLAMTRSVAALLPDSRVTLKWPNDVLVDGKKVAGLLAELLPTADGVVIGAGVNLTIGRDDLPTPTSTSLSLHSIAPGAPGSGAPALGDTVLAGFLEELRALYARFIDAGADAAASGILAEVSENCSSIGQQVRVELPGGDTLQGLAVALDESGRLRVKRDSDATVQAVAAGDVTHLRYE